MPKKQKVLPREKVRKYSLFIKLLVISILVFIIGSVYRVYMYGEGPLASLFGEANSINLVNGLDPEEAAFLQKTITTKTPASAPTPIKVTVKDPVTKSNTTALVTLKPVIEGDGLEAEEAAFLQKSTSIDKPNSVGTAPPPVVKVTIFNESTQTQESSYVTLKPSSATEAKNTPIKELVDSITTKVVETNKRVKHALKSPYEFNLNTPAGQAAFTDQIEYIANIISACQNDGYKLKADLRKCFCGRIDCRDSWSKKIADGLGTYGPTRLNDPTTVLECVEFVSITMMSYYRSDGSFKSPYFLGENCASGKHAKDLDRSCLPKERGATGNWYYCDTKYVREIQDGDVLIFGSVGKKDDPGHIAFTQCAPGQNSVSTCQMIDANSDKFGSVRVHPIADYKVPPKGFWRYIPSGSIPPGCRSSKS